MTEAQKAATYDLLVRRKVIVVRTGQRLVDEQMQTAKWIEHGPTKDIFVEDFVS
jgi:hypothetical protein